MKFYVATHNYLLEVTGWPGGEPDVTVKDEGHFHGITGKGKDAYYTKRWPVPNNDGLPIYSESFILRQTEDEVTLFEGGLNSVHDIAATELGLWICDTGVNRVVFLSHDQTWGAEYLFGGTAQDINHPNTIRPVSNREVLVMLHNKGRKPSQLIGLRCDKRRGLRRMSRLNLDHEECHDIELYRKADMRMMAYNASKAGLLVEKRRGPAHGNVIGEFDGYTKGLARLDDGSFLVGRSPRAERIHRHDTAGEIIHYDPEDPPNAEILSLSNVLGEPSGNVNNIVLVTQDE